MPIVSEMAYKLDYFGVLRYTLISMNYTLLRCECFFATYNETTLALFVTKMIKNTGALPSVLKKNVDSI